MTALIALPGAAQAQSRINPGDSVSGRLTDSDPKLGDDSHYDCYVFDLSERHAVEVVMGSDDFDTYLALGSGGECADSALETNDDGPSMGTNSQIQTTLEAGRYFIRANSLSSNVTGAYTLSFQVDGGAASGDSQSGNVLDDLAEVSGELTASDRRMGDGSYYDCYSVRARAGQTVGAMMLSNDFDAYVSLYRGGECGGEAIASDDDSAGDTDAVAEFVADRDGLYSIAANSLGADETGVYVIIYGAVDIE